MVFFQGFGILRLDPLQFVVELVDRLFPDVDILLDSHDFCGLRG
jgi:hypothetical protein